MTLNYHQTFFFVCFRFFEVGWRPLWYILCCFSRFLKWDDASCDIFYVVFPGFWSGMTPPVIYFMLFFQVFEVGWCPLWYILRCFSRFLKCVDAPCDIFYVVFPGSWSAMTPPVIYFMLFFPGSWSVLTPPLIYFMLFFQVLEVGWRPLWYILCFFFQVLEVCWRPLWYILCCFSSFLKWDDAPCDIFYVVFQFLEVGWRPLWYPRYR